MNYPAPSFDEIAPSEPRLEAVKARYDKIVEALREGRPLSEHIETMKEWDALRREIDTWTSWAQLRFHQDTADEERKKARERSDELRPKFEEQDKRVKTALLEHDKRDELEEHFGNQAFELWEASVRTFDPSIEELLIEESRLRAEYTSLRSSAEIEFQGETYNLSGLAKFSSDADRKVRHAASKARWGWFEENADELDEIYDKLVDVRTKMARELGYDNYEGMGYDRMHRIDYDREDVETFRAEVRRLIVPLVGEIRKKQAETLGIDKVMAWDEGIYDPKGNPKPQGDRAWMVEQAYEMFDHVSDDLHEFYSMMVDLNMLDLDNRPTKAGGGFCTAFPEWGIPFIFANFNGTKHDASVFTHEMGHAFQVWSSREQPLYDYLWPTLESCEIHSMSLEYLVSPKLDVFFGDRTEDFRRIHLLENLLFLPYGCAVDHFQHLVYQNPDATPDERAEFWQQMEEMYLPSRDYGDLPHVSSGRLWQGQLHIYEVPYYYIDYTLAETCALQFWVRSREDYEQAVEDYTALCKRGGSLPFNELAKSAGLSSPFARGSLERVVDAAREELDI
jgi:M3 family oligoendopeptidase